MEYEKEPMGRRNFMQAAIAAAAAPLLGASGAVIAAREATGAGKSKAPAPNVAAPEIVKLAPLPWKPSALSPVISSKTVGVHYGKHHKGYVDNLNKLLVAAPHLRDLSLIEIIRATAGDPAQRAIFNNAAQIWNHSFYWESLTPRGGGALVGADVAKYIAASFGTQADFEKAFIAAGMGQFGSGWAWLVFDKTAQKVAILKTSNADTPITDLNLVPLAVLDVWEHAYYIDYQNLRGDYANAVVSKLFNWRHVEANLSNV